MKYRKRKYLFARSLKENQKLARIENRYRAKFLKIIKYRANKNENEKSSHELKSSIELIATYSNEEDTSVDNNDILEEPSVFSPVKDKKYWL